MCSLFDITNIKTLKRNGHPAWSGSAFRESVLPLGWSEVSEETGRWRFPVGAEASKRAQHADGAGVQSVNSRDAVDGKNCGN